VVDATDKKKRKREKKKGDECQMYRSLLWSVPRLGKYTVNNSNSGTLFVIRFMLTDEASNSLSDL